MSDDICECPKCGRQHRNLGFGKPPAIIENSCSSNESLEQAKRSITAALIGSCECNTKSPEATYHAAHCRYLKLLFALDCIDAAGASPMALKIWTDFKIGDRVMVCDNQRDIGTVLELAPDATVAGRALCRWDNGDEPSWLRADLLTPSPHVEDEAWEYMLDLLLNGEVTIADFRSQMMNAGYHVQQINNAIDYNYQEIRDMTAPELA